MTHLDPSALSMLRALFGLGLLTVVMAIWMTVTRMPAMKQAGLSLEDIRTYPKLREAAKKIKAANNVPAVAIESFPWVLEGALLSNGTQIVKNGKLNLADKAALEVIENWAGFFRDETAIVGNASSNLDFCAEKFALRFSSVASRPQIKANCKFAFKVAPLPYFKKPAVPVGGATLAISKGVAPEKLSDYAVDVQVLEGLRLGATDAVGVFCRYAPPSTQQYSFVMRVGTDDARMRSRRKG